MEAHAKINQTYKDFSYKIPETKIEFVQVNVIDFAKTTKDITYDVLNENIYKPLVDYKYVKYNLDGIDKDNIVEFLRSSFYYLIKMNVKTNTHIAKFISSDKDIQEFISYFIKDLEKQAATEIWLEKRESYTIDVSDFTLNPVVASNSDYSAEEFFNRSLLGFLDHYKVLTIDFTKCNNATSEFVEKMISLLYDHLGDGMFNQRIKFEKQPEILKSLEKVLRSKYGQT